MTRALRHALTRRCRVRSCALLPYISGTITTNRSIKTLAAVLPWLYRRTAHPEPDVRVGTPRWLVIVLPQRALVEQTVRVIRGWLANLESRVPVHVLMGGEDADDSRWRYEPATERIFVGTQDT